MRIYRTLILPVLLLCNACLNPENRESDTIAKKKVILVPFLTENDNPASKEDHTFQDTSYLDLIFRNNNLVNIQDMDSTLQVHLRYSDTSNFLGIGFYDGLKVAYLHCEAAIMLCNAQYFLKQINPDYSLLVLDASRPLHIQQMMWDSLDMPVIKKYQYLSPPSEPSLHNYGCAVDVTIINTKTKKTLDMGSQHDQFDKFSEPASENALLKTGELSREAYDNRILLRRVMTRAKYKPITTEWWHFSICTKPEAAKRFHLIQ